MLAQATPGSLNLWVTVMNTIQSKPALVESFIVKPQTKQFARKSWLVHQARKKSSLNHKCQVYADCEWYSHDNGSSPGKRPKTASICAKLSSMFTSLSDID